MKKITYTEFRNAMIKFNEEHGITTKCNKEKLYGVIVFKESSFTKPYTEIQRSYKTNSDQKAFINGMCSNSIFADCLDGTDNGVRLDWYMFDENGWKVDYCYLIEEGDN